MENKLELKHLAPYLPYGLKMRTKCNSTIKLLGFNQVNGRLIFQLNVDEEDISVDEIKPILRPLSSLIKEIEHNGEKFVPYEKLYDYSDYEDFLSEIKDDSYEMRTPVRWPYQLVKRLFEWHFDIFGLIEKGLAIDL